MEAAVNASAASTHNEPRYRSLSNTAASAPFIKRIYPRQHSRRADGEMAFSGVAIARERVPSGTSGIQSSSCYDTSQTLVICSAASSRRALQLIERLRRDLAIVSSAYPHRPVADS